MFPKSRLVWVFVAAVNTPLIAQEPPNLLTDPSFENDAAWAPQGDVAFDDANVRSGKRSARCHADEPLLRGGLLQQFELNQKSALLLLIGGWSRAEKVSGPKDSHYSIWCDVKYVEQLRPGRIDKAAIAKFNVGTHDWQEVRAILTPQRPIKTVKLYALFRHHTGTVWFDDIFVRELKPFVPHALPKSDSTPAALAGRCSLFVGDYGRREFWHVPREAGTDDLRAELTDAGLSVKATFVQRADAVEVTGWVHDTTGEDRAVDVCLTLPAGGDDWQWWQDIGRPYGLRNDAAVATNDFPLACVTKDDAGVALGIPPDSPCVFALEYTPVTGLMARVKLGLTKHASGDLHSRAPFRFCVFPVDPTWGFRDALRRYYDLYPDLFQRRAKAEGLWLFAFPPGKLPNPQHYAYWEGGPRGAKQAIKNGIGCYPYRIPVQRSIVRLPKLPADYDEAMTFFDSYAPDHSGFGGEGTKKQIENAAIHDAHGHYDIRIRDDVGADVKPKNPINMVVFSVNCNPNLFADTDALTPAKDDLSRVTQRLATNPEIAGVYLDSMTGWSGRKLNFRRDHFRYETIPLTYDDVSGRVAIHGKFDGVQFLKGLGEVLHPTGRLVFQNLGHAPEYAWYWFYGDVCGCEGAFRGLSDAQYDFFRASACQKPVLLLDYATVVGRSTGLDTRTGMEKYFKYATAYGFYPAIGRHCDKAYQDHKDLYDTYIPIIKRLSAAGWKPVTGARTSADGVRLERFGPHEGTMYLTVFNPTDKSKLADVTWQLDVLGWRNVRHVTSLLTGEAIDAGTSFALDLPPMGLEVLCVRSE